MKDHGFATGEGIKSIEWGNCVKKHFLVLVMVAISFSSFAQTFQLADWNLLGISESKFLDITKVSQIPFDEETSIMTQPCSNYTDMYGFKGNKIQVAVRYDNAGLSKLVMEKIPATADNPVIFTTTMMTYQQMGTLYGKDDSGNLYFRMREGVILLSNQGDGVIVMLFTHACAKEFGVAGE